MSSVYIHPVLAACIVKAEQKLGRDTWTPANDPQAAFIEQLPRLRHLCETLPDGMLSAIGSTSADAVNAFLAEHNMPFRVPQFGPPDFATAAVLEILAKWAKPGAAVSLYSDGVKYPAVEMKAGDFSISRVDVTGEEVASLLCDNCTVHLVVANSLERGMTALREPAQGVSSREYKSLVFPKIDHDTSVDVSWLVDMRSGDAMLTQAFAHAKLRVDEVGAHAKAAAAILVTRSIEVARPLVIDKPFVLAFDIGGEILVAFHLTHEAWKAPPVPVGTAKAKVPGDTW